MGRDRVLCTTCAVVQMGKTALHYACSRGMLKTIGALMIHGADPCALDNGNRTALEDALDEE